MPIEVDLPRKEEMLESAVQDGEIQKNREQKAERGATYVVGFLIADHCDCKALESHTAPRNQDLLQAGRTKVASSSMLARGDDLPRELLPHVDKAIGAKIRPSKRYLYMCFTSKMLLLPRL